MFLNILSSSNSSMKDNQNLKHLANQDFEKHVHDAVVSCLIALDYFSPQENEILKIIHNTNMHKEKAIHSYRKV